MTVLEKTRELLAQLSEQEQTQLLLDLLTALNFPSIGVSHKQGVCGGRACIRNTRIPVWTIIEAKQQGATDIALLQSFPELTAEDLTNAMRYYQGHKEEIDADLEAQLVEE